MDERTNAPSPHDLLQALAGRVDDDLLAWCRELTAVGEDDRAVELACAALAAARAELPPPVRAALVAAARAARTDLDADAVLRPAREEPGGTAHRFDAAPAVVGRLAAAVAGLPARQVSGCRLHVTARTTPAGSAPGPVPQPILVAGIAPDDPRPADVLAYQLAIACARAGVPAAVEVVVDGTPLPGYQRAALDSARPVDGDASVPEAGALPAAREETVAPRSSLADRMAAWDSFDVPDHAGPAPDAAPRADPGPLDADPALPDGPAPVVTEDAPAPDDPTRPDATGPDGHAPAPDDRPTTRPPDPAPLRSGPVVAPSGGTWPARDDASTGEPSRFAAVDEPAPDAMTDGGAPEPDDRPRWPASGSLVLPSLPRRAPEGRPDRAAPAPRPVPRPTALRPLVPPTSGPQSSGSRPSGSPASEAPNGPSNGHRPADTGRDAAVRPLRPANPDTPAFASLGDPFTDPVGPRPDPEPAVEPTIDAADPLGLGPLPLASDERPRDPEGDSWLADWLTGDWAMPGSSGDDRPDPGADPAARPSPRPTPAVRPVPRPSRAPDDSATPRPGPAERLNDEDRELLARLQAELGPGEPGSAERPRVTRRAGIAPNGRSPRPAPPDVAG